jgi:hypothetical protein
VFTARYALSPYIKQIRFVFKGLIRLQVKRKQFLCSNSVTGFSVTVMSFFADTKINVGATGYTAKSREHCMGMTEGNGDITAALCVQNNTACLMFK